MQIFLAEHAGFCFGVERAIRIVEDTANTESKVSTLGPIIHNPQVVSCLSAKGVSVTKNIDNVAEEDTVIVRSHGITKKSFEKLKQHTSKVVDATCPFVKKAHTAASALDIDGYTIIILGEADHPEVEGIVSYVKGKYYIVADEMEVSSLPKMDKCGLIAQTTQNKEVFEKVKEQLAEQCKSVKVINTICNATTLRQKTAKMLAKQVDLMLVIGGKNSANTTRLFKICNEICLSAYHIETKDDLKLTYFSNIEKVGITAGASTPKYLIDEVVEYIKEVDHAREHISQ